MYFTETGKRYRK